MTPGVAAHVLKLVGLPPGGAPSATRAVRKLPVRSRVEYAIAIVLLPAPGVHVSPTNARSVSPSPSKSAATSCAPLALWAMLALKPWSALLVDQKFPLKFPAASVPALKAMGIDPQAAPLGDVPPTKAMSANPSPLKSPLLGGSGLCCMIAMKGAFWPRPGGAPAA